MAATTLTGFLDSMRAAAPGHPSGTAWLDRLRSLALERANALSVPNTRDEEWRFTDLSALARLTFQPVDAPVQVALEELRSFILPEACARLVFVDGLWSPVLSVLPNAQPGVHVHELRSALSACPQIVEAQLGRLAKFDTQLFPALNTAFLRDAAVIALEAERALPGPLHVLHVTAKRDRAHALYPRTLLVAGAGSRCTLIEDFVHLGAGTYFSAPVTEIVLAANASVEHIRVQREGMDGFHVAVCAVTQAAGSRYAAVHAALGGRITRLDHNIVHDAPGCETVLNGLTLIDQRQLADTHSFVDHAYGPGRLRQVQKCVVGGAAHAVFNGKVLVREGAFQTDAAQSCRALLLSDRAHIDVKPQLEIFADDVKCAHGAAIGQLDPDALFYLRSRGLSAATARSMLTYAFAAEVIEKISVRSLVSALTTEVMALTQESR